MYINTFYYFLCSPLKILLNTESQKVKKAVPSSPGYQSPGSPDGCVFHTSFIETRNLTLARWVWSLFHSIPCADHVVSTAIRNYSMTTKPRRPPSSYSFPYSHTCPPTTRHRPLATTNLLPTSVCHFRHVTYTEGIGGRSPGIHVFPFHSASSPQGPRQPLPLSTARSSLRSRSPRHGAPARPVSY